MAERTVKFEEMLGELINLRGFSKKRGELAKAANITSSALSQFLSGRAKPSMDTLVKLSDILETSLDYLVYGAANVTREVVDAGPMVRYIDHSLAELHKRAADHASLVDRISRVLGSQIDEAARQVVASVEDAAAGGLCDDNDAITIEQFSICTRTVSMDLKHDVVQTETGFAFGRYGQLLAENLQAGRSYQFLLPGEHRAWEGLVEGFRDLVSRTGVTDEAISKRLLVRESLLPLPVGFVLYDLDVTGLRVSNALLYEHISHAIGPTGLFGCVLAPSDDMTASATMDVDHRDHADQSFDAIWNSKNSRAL